MSTVVIGKGVLGTARHSRAVGDGKRSVCGGDVCAATRISDDVAQLRHLTPQRDIGGEAVLCQRHLLHHLPSLTLPRFSLPVHRRMNSLQRRQVTVVVPSSGQADKQTSRQADKQTSRRR
jgi:hypothetical protein